ncbi:unnamed protein product [Choristocarpus tenellus]
MCLPLYYYYWGSKGLSSLKGFPKLEGGAACHTRRW